MTRDPKPAPKKGMDPAVVKKLHDAFLVALRDPKVKEIMSKNGFYQGKDPMNFAATAPGMWVGRGKPLPF